MFGIVPFGHLAVSSIRQMMGRQSGILRQYRNALIGGVVGCLVVLHAHLYHGKETIGDWFFKRQAYAGDWTLTLHDTFYIDLLRQGVLIPRWIWETTLSLIGICILLGLVRYRQKIVKNMLYVSVYILIPLIGLSLIRLKSTPHIVILIPFIALMISGAMHLIPGRYIRACLTTGLIIYGLSAHFVGFCSPGMRETIENNIYSKSLGHLTFYSIYGSLRIPVTLKWEQGYAGTIDSIVRDWEKRAGIYDETGKIVSTACVLSLLDGNPQGTQPLEYYALRIKAPLLIIALDRSEKARYDVYDYVIQAENIPYYYDFIRIVEADIKNKESIFWEHFKLLDEIEIGNGQKMIAYKQR
jgi:hypothetical protein